MCVHVKLCMKLCTCVSQCVYVCFCARMHVYVCVCMDVMCMYDMHIMCVRVQAC
jgi:hypothetical protein